MQLSISSITSYRKQAGKAQIITIWAFCILASYCPIVDLPHFEFPTALTMAQKRDRVAKGIPLVHVSEPIPATPTKVWSVEYDDEQIVSDCKDTAAVRAVVEKAFGGSIGVDDAKKVITVYRPK